MNGKQMTNGSAQLDLNVSSVVLQRLVEEVAAGANTPMRAYNRTHNRHNR